MKIYENIVARQSGVDYSPVIQQVLSKLTNQKNSSRAINREIRIISNKIGAGMAPSKTTNYLKVLPLGDCNDKDQQLDLGMGLSESNTREGKKICSNRVRSKKLVEEAAGESEKSYEGASAVNVESNLGAEATEGGYF